MVFGSRRLHVWSSLCLNLIVRSREFDGSLSGRDDAGSSQSGATARMVTLARSIDLRAPVDLRSEDLASVGILIFRPADLAQNVARAEYVRINSGEGVYDGIEMFQKGPYTIAKSCNSSCRDKTHVRIESLHNLGLLEFVSKKRCTPRSESSEELLSFSTQQQRQQQIPRSIITTISLEV